MLRGTRVAGMQLARRGLTVKANLRQAGRYSLRLVLLRRQLVPGKTYVIRINAAGAATRKTLALRFRA